MATVTIQARLPKRLVKEIDNLVKKEFYTNRSDLIRNAVREIVMLKSMVGIIPNTGDSVKEVRELRKKLSKEPFDLDEINNL